MTIGHSELVAIIGGRGSGKTTLLDAMSGLRPPSSGTVARSSIDTARAVGYVGYIPNADTILPVLPLDRALRYAAALRGTEVGGSVGGGSVGGGRGGDDRVAAALGTVGLAAQAATPAGQLDAGQRKRAAIAAGLLARPAQLFLEEPTIGLDPAQAAELMRRLRRLCDGGITVVLTTQNPLDAARCDKVAVLATGGHLAFFGTPEAACDYFAADSLDEIYERLAGLGDPAAAWSRRFPQFSRTVPGFTAAPTTPPRPGPPRLVPDTAGPHSAGRASTGLFAGEAFAEDLDPDLDPGQAGAGSVSTDVLDDRWPEYGPEIGQVGPANLIGSGGQADAAVTDPNGVTPAIGHVRRFRQWSVLSRRNVDALVRSRPTLAALAGAPAAVLLAFLVLLGRGALDPARPGGAFWAVFAGLFVGLAYGVPQIRPELGSLRGERFWGLSASAYVLAKAAVLIPPLAVADAIVLLVPGLSGRLHGGGYGPVFVTLLLSSAVALALGLLISAAAPTPPGGLTALAVSLPPVLLGAALLALLDEPIWGDWLSLAAVAVALLAATTALIARRTPVGTA
jgi:ABC-type multidrug transport system ATPase subunit